jgi:uncharacterized protein (TIGR00251 family)
MTNSTIQEVDDGVIFVTKIVPGSSKTAVSGWLEGMLKIKVAAHPQKQKANQCLIEFLAKKLSVKKNAVDIRRGRNNPIKHVHVSGISADVLLEKLNLTKPRS